MWKGDIISESLEDPNILNELTQHHVTVEVLPDYPAEPIWHTFKVEINDQDINRLTKELSENIKEGWYAHFWDGEQFLVVLPNQVFTNTKDKTTPEYKAMIDYASSHGVEARFLDIGASW